MQSSSQTITANKSTPSFFTGRIPVLSQNQHQQNTEGKFLHIYINKHKVKWNKTQKVIHTYTYQSYPHYGLVVRPTQRRHGEFCCIVVQTFLIALMVLISSLAFSYINVTMQSYCLHFTYLTVAVKFVHYTAC